MYPYYRVNGWEPILALLQQSLYAEEMVCSITSELFHIPSTKDLEGNREMHAHLIPASYHRVTAVGSAQRLKNGEQQQSIIQTLTTCIILAENEDQQVQEGLVIMEENASPEFKTFINLAMRWQVQAESALKQTKEALQAMGVQLPAGGEPPQDGDYQY